MKAAPIYSGMETTNFNMLQGVILLFKCILLLVVTCSPVWAIQAPKQNPGTLREKALVKSEMRISVLSEPLETIKNRMPGRHDEAVKRFSKKYGRQFQLHIDPRSGVPTNIIGHIPMLPGKGTDNHLTHRLLGEEMGEPVSSVDDRTVSKVIRKFIAENLDVLNIDDAQVGEVHCEQINDNLWQVRVSQAVNGIKVRGARLAATISHGNMIMIGAEKWGTVRINTALRISAEEALDKGFAYVGGRQTGDSVMSQPVLEIIPVAPQQSQDEHYTGIPGEGYEYRLVWTFSFKRPPEAATWEMMVEARTGEVLALQDKNEYVTSSITGGLYPGTNTEVCPANTCCGAMQANQPMPFADTGLPAPNDFTNSAGLFEYNSGTIATRLFGKYVWMQDSCGAISETAFGSDGLNIGGINGQHDCDTGGYSAGNTAAARTAFYELNRIREMARGYLPNFSRLSLPLTAYVNVNDICNAFFDGQSVNFYKSGSGCGNSGEISGILTHEWAHWLDNGSNGASNPGESFADIAAMYSLQSSCIGYGFYQNINLGCGLTTDGTGVNTNLAQTGGSRCALNCSGLRETDWDQLTGPSQTPDTPQNFVCSRCSTNVYGQNGPCGKEVHCESAVDTEAAWDFAARDLQSPPFGYDSNTAFLIANGIFYRASGSIGNWHTCSCADSSSGGCGATNAYMQWLAADDDDGNINNGTPHMSALYNAFNRHGIACAAPAPVNSGCSGGPVTAPTVTTSAGDGQVGLSWSAVPAATRYRVSRSEGLPGCDAGKTPIATVTGNTIYTDNNLANGRQYCYTVMALGSSDTCLTPASVCSCVTPSLGPHGILQGRVNDSATGNPISDATVTATGGYATLTDSSGFYQFVDLPAGTYDVTVSGAYGHVPQTAPGIVIPSTGTVGRDFFLTATPITTVQGTVTDGSGHGWPLYATIDITSPGYSKSIHTDPLTGQYSVTIPTGTPHAFAVNTLGYRPITRTITPALGGGAENFVLTTASCLASGYAGASYLETFEYGDGGFSVSGTTSWAFGAPVSTLISLAPATGHSGTHLWGTNLIGFYHDNENGYITSPKIDLRNNAGQPSTLSWWQWLASNTNNDFASVEVSKDGGTTWAVVYGPVSGIFAYWTRQSIALDPSYSVSNFRVRFHFTSNPSFYLAGWYVDDVSVQSLNGCQPVPGGLVVGNAYDSATATGLNNVTITDGAGHQTITSGTPDDPELGDGFYQLSLPAGNSTISAVFSGSSDVKTVFVVADSIVRQDFSLPLEALVISTSALSNGAAGSGYSQTLAATGGLAPYSWAKLSGNLPAGLSFSSTGVISGIPVTTGVFNFTVQLTDATATSVTRSLAIVVYDALTVSGYQPADGTWAPDSTTVQATFSAPLYPASVTAGNFTLFRCGTPIALAAGYGYTVAVKIDGTVAGWGDNSYGQSTATAGLTGVRAIAAGDSHTVALKNDGTVVAWGRNDHGQATVPAGLTGVSAIAAGTVHTVALKSDGTVVAWGYNYYGAATVPLGLTGVIAIAAGDTHTVALKQDGTVVAWGFNNNGQTIVPEGLTGVTAISAGAYYSVALKADGTVVAWGDNNYGQTTVPAGLTGVNAIAAGGFHTVALKNDGTVAAWGYDEYGQATVPAGLAGVTAIAGGRVHSVALKSDGTLAAWGWDYFGQSTVPAAFSGGNTVNGALSYDPTLLTVTFTPSTLLTSNAAYFARIWGITSLTGISLANPVTWSFTASDAVTITTAALPGGMVAAPYSQTLLASGGKPPFAWTESGDLPTGLSLDGAGVIQGTPTVTGTFDFTVQVTDVNGISATKALSIVVQGALTITTETLPVATTTIDYSQTLAASGGSATYAWSISSGVLPSGLSLNGTTGVISGTPTATGIFIFTVRVTDGTGASAQKSYTVAAIIPSVRITGIATSYFTVIQQAYSAAASADTLDLYGIDFAEDLTFNHDIAIHLRGGFDDNFTGISGFTYIHGCLTFIAGTVSLDKIVIMP